MTSTIPLRFVCDVLPATRMGAFVHLHIVALFFGGMVVGPAFLWGVWGVFFGIGILLALLRSGSGNPILEFYRQFDSARGNASPPECICCTRWLLFVVVSAGVLLLWPSPLWTLLVAWTALAWFIHYHLKRTQHTFSDAIDDFVELMFVFLAYPDDRYRASVGHGALWLPSQSSGGRLARAAAHLAPLYVVLAGAWVRWLMAGEHVEPDASWVVTIALLLPLPTALLFAALLAPWDAYLRATHAVIGTNEEWERAVFTVANSTFVEGDVALADHFYIGSYLPKHEAAEHPFKSVGRLDLPCRTPALLHRSILFGHVHLLGSTQAGKTAIALTTLLVQIIRGWIVRAVDYFGRPVLDASGNQVWKRSEQFPALVIDMKRDLALFNTVREECRKSGQTFKYFTLSQGLATSYFNALPNLGIQGRHVGEFSELVLNALSLFHGLAYGRSYFSKQSRDLLLKTLKNSSRKPESWEELHELLLTEIDPKKHKDVFELVSSIFALAQYPVLGPAPAGVDVIHMPTVIAERQVVFFDLPARLSAISARDVGKLALFAFVTAAADWNDRNPERRSFVFLDEAQIICSSNLATLFQQCSGAKTSIVFSNQARSDLDVPDAPNLSETVRVNTRFKQMFTVVDPQDAEDLMRISGERIGILRTFSRGTDGQGNATSSVTERETLCRFLNQNDINAVNNDPNGSLIHVTTDAGFTRLNGVARHIRTPYPLTAQEYRKRLHTPWPAAPETVSAPGSTARTVVNKREPEDVQLQAEQDFSELMNFFRQAARRAGRDRMHDWMEPDEP